jgi:hypothetical protein
LTIISSQPRAVATPTAVAVPAPGGDDVAQGVDNPRQLSSTDGGEVITVPLG